MSFNFFNYIKHHNEIDLPLGPNDFTHIFREYSQSSSQNRGIIAELLVILLFSRLTGEWGGSQDRYEYYDLVFGGFKVDIKTTSSSKYSLAPTSRQLFESYFQDEQILYLLVSVEEWNTKRFCVRIKFHEAVLLESQKIRKYMKFSGERHFHIIEENAA